MTHRDRVYLGTAGTPHAARDLREYRSFGSFAPLYTHAKAYLAENLQNTSTYRPVIWILEKLAEHADEYGLSHVGNRTLARKAHYSLKTTEDALAVLYDLDFVRGHLRMDYVRNKQEFDHQINPDVIWIAPHAIGHAISLWSAANVKWILMNDLHPSSNQPESRLNQPQSRRNPSTTTTRRGTRSASPETGSPDLEPESRDRSADREADQPTTPQAQSAATKSHNPKPAPSSAPPPPVYPALNTCDVEQDEETEEIALKIKRLVSCTMPEARQLIAPFVLDDVDILLEKMTVDHQRGAFRSPYGVLKHRLEKLATRRAEVEAES